MTSVRSALKSKTPESARKALRQLRYHWSSLPHSVRCSLNKTLFLRRFLDRKKLHLGCGNVRLDGFLNVDYRATVATDIAHDCSNLSFAPDGCFTTVFANAFMEHLYREQQKPCLMSVYRTLSKDGTALFLGIPDFRSIAQAYIDRRPGMLSDTFDLYHVYRYTHGDPEMAPDWWLEQLHKSLFDLDSVCKLLEDAGFSNYCLFTYAFQDEPVSINLGFVGFRTRPDFEPTIDWLKQFVSNYSADPRPDSIVLERLQLT